MSLIALVLTLIVVGILLWLVETYIPMDPTLKRILHVVVIIAVIVWLLSVFGVWAYLGEVTVPRVRR